jgi:thioredoxin reductase (NADPH)
MIRDAIIIGGGPAGATAAIYLARAGFKKTIVLYKDFGALEKAERVDNYYGASKITGIQMVERGLRQARAAGAKTYCEEILSVQKNPNGNLTVKSPYSLIEARAVLLATGTNRVAPDIPGLAEYEGRGVSYCAVCDGFFYRDKDVAVLGNDEYALHEINDLLPIAASVTLLTNGKELLKKPPSSVDVRTEKIREIIGGENKKTLAIAGVSNKIFNGVIFENGEELSLSALFIAEGTAGGTELARKIGAAISGDVIKTDSEKRTSVSGLWAAGDCIGGLKQIVKAAHDGAEAGLSMVKYLRQKK